MIRVMHVLPPKILFGDLLEGIRRYTNSAEFELHFATLGESEHVPAGENLPALDSLGLGFRNQAFLPFSVARLARELRVRHIDVVHTHLFWPGVVGLLAGRLASTRAVVQTRHYSDLLAKMGMARKGRLYGRIAPLMDLTLANSEWTRKVMVQDEGIPPAKVRVVPVGVQFEKLQPAPSDAHVVNRARWAGDSDFLVGAIGRLTDQKGFDVALEAFARVKESKPKARLLVAGSGPKGEHLREHAKRLGLEDAVRWIPFLPPADLRSFYDAIDVFVHPSISEGFGLVVAEAMGMGKAVVAFDMGPMREIVQPGRTGMLVPEGNVSLLGQAMLDLASDPAMRKRLGLGAQVTARNSFDIRPMVTGYEQAYRDLLSDGTD